MMLSVVLFLAAFCCCSHGKPANSRASYILQGKQGVKELRALIEAPRETTWPDIAQEDEQVKIYVKESPFPDLSEDIFLLDTEVKAPVKKVATLLSPFLEYKLKWDTIYEFVHVHEDLGDETYVIHEAVYPMMLLSARDAVDVCRQEIHGKAVVMACRNTTHPAVPENEDYVRTTQRLIGYYLLPADDMQQKTRVQLVFGADLNIVSFLSSFVKHFKPGQLMDLVDRLRHAIIHYDI